MGIPHSTWKEKTPSIPWNCGMACIAFRSLRLWTTTEESQMTGHRKICQIGLRGNIQNYLCLVIFWILNLMRGEYEKDVRCLVVWLSFKRGVFVLQNSLPLWGSRVYFYDIAPEVDIASYQLYWLWAYPKAWEMHKAIWKLAGNKLIMISNCCSMSN